MFKEEFYETQRKISEAKAYLASTDWYVIRQSETGVKIPTDILNKRKEARKLCNTKIPLDKENKYQA